jgi:hypothetical protein
MATSPATRRAVVAPPFSTEVVTPHERFGSMSVTRNPTGAAMSRDLPSYLRQAPRDNTLKVDDIAGALPRRRTGRERDTFHATGDIEGAAPKALHTVRSGHHDILSVDDIEGARARSTDLHTKRVVNPLDPVYKLPTAPAVSPPTMPFKRDSYLVDDIPGTRATGGTGAMGNMKPRANNILNVDDVPGARPRPLVHTATGHLDSMDVSDIIHGGVFQTKRCT